MAQYVLLARVMAARHFKELTAWQLAEAFKNEIFSVAKKHPRVMSDWKFRSQLLDAADAVPNDIAEGFVRKSPLTFANFLDYALGSLVEAERRLISGARLEFYEESVCQPALRLAKRCLTATIRLKQSQIRYAEERRQARGKHSRKRDPSDQSKSPD